MTLDGSGLTIFRGYHEYNFFNKWQIVFNEPLYHSGLLCKVLHLLGSMKNSIKIKKPNNHETQACNVAYLEMFETSTLTNWP